MKKLATCLWFDDDGLEAAKFYCAIFKGKVDGVWKYGKAGPGRPGSVMFVEFRVLGMNLQALNGGPVYKHSAAMSLSVPCKDQKEVDFYWKRLLAGGGKPVACGWLTDKFGVSWQVVPEALMRYQRHKDAKLRERVQRAMMGMVKLDVAGLEKAAKG